MCHIYIFIMCQVSWDQFVKFFNEIYLSTVSVSFRDVCWDLEMIYHFQNQDKGLKFFFRMGMYLNFCLHRTQINFDIHFDCKSFDHLVYSIKQISKKCHLWSHTTTWHLICKTDHPSFSRKWTIFKAILDRTEYFKGHPMFFSYYDWNTFIEEWK